MKNTMNTEKPNLKQVFSNTGDIRYIIDLFDIYQYTDDEVSELVNIYLLYENNYIPEVEHIEVVSQYYPNCALSNQTLKGVEISFPERYKYIINQYNHLII